MTSAILINKNEIDEIRIAFIENNKLNNFEIENENNKSQKGNIFKGFITKIEPSLDALFIDYGADKDGFLPFKEVSKDYLDILNLYDGIASLKEYNMILGKTFIIQIEKEESNGKGALLTTYLNFAGCYIVLMPNSSDLKGISKKINNNYRYYLKTLLSDMDFLNNIGLIIRTFGHGKELNVFKHELLMLLSQLKFIKNLYNNHTINLIYEHNNLIIRTIRDYIKFNVSEIIIDDVLLFNSIYKYLSILRSNFLSKINLHTESLSLFSKYNIENQIEFLFKREIYLPSGGSITIDSEEALTFIDINSSKSNKCDDVEETALQTNLEAINEIAKQLKIRDLGGLIIVDFIDVDIDSFVLIKKKLKDVLSFDKAKIKLEKISSFGLLEMSRERLKSSLNENKYIACHKCLGTGKLSNLIDITWNLLKTIENEITTKDIYQINIELPIKIINYLINTKKKILNYLENKYMIKINLISNEYLTSPDYKIYTFVKSNKITTIQKKIPIKKKYLHFFNKKVSYKKNINNFTTKKIYLDNNRQTKLQYIWAFTLNAWQ